MPAIETMFFLVLAMCVASAAAAITIAVAVDARRRPAVRRVVEKLMQLALMAAAAIIAALGSKGLQ